MGKYYLQEQITPVANKYVIVGSDGNLTTGDILAFGTTPKIFIDYPSAITEHKNGTVSVDGTWIATCLLNNKTVPITYSYTDKCLVCFPIYFGPWQISYTDSNNITVTSTSFYPWDISNDVFSNTAVSELSEILVYQTTESDFS